ncbi:MAG TPA: hypothetical protein VFM70_04455 [Salinimicrobium sp.]|nr:hypothetical protein [Salinimicrobium sp.]
MNFNFLKAELMERGSQHLENQPIFSKLQDAGNLYHLLTCIKEDSDFLFTNEIIDADWFSAFPEDLLLSLHIYTKGYNNLLMNTRCFTAIVVDCHLSCDVLDNSFAGIQVYGKGYLETKLMGKSASVIKIKGRSGAEVRATDHAVVNISTWDKSNLLIEAEKNSLVLVMNRSRGGLRATGNDQLIIKRP